MHALLYDWTHISHPLLHMWPSSVQEDLLEASKEGDIAKVKTLLRDSNVNPDVTAEVC